MKHIFISYSTKNKTIAQQLCTMLERDELACWIAPRNIPPGFEWRKTIVHAIAESQLMLAVLSEDACHSDHVARELELAAEKKVPILPVRLDATPLEEKFEYVVGGKQWLDISGTDRQSLDDSATAVVDAVRTLIAPSNSSPAAAEVTRATPTSAQSRKAEQIARGRGVHAIIDELRSVVTTFFAVAMRRERALSDFDLSDSKTTFFAFRFLLYVSLATAILHIPEWRAQGIRYADPAFMSLAVAIDLIEKIALCLALYAAIRLFKAEANPQQFFGAFCFFGTYLLMSDVFLVSVQGARIDIRSVRIDHIGDLLTLLVAFMASIGLKFVLLLGLFKAFHVTHQLGVARARTSLAVAIALWIVSLLVVCKPFEDKLFKAFGGY